MINYYLIFLIIFFYTNILSVNVQTTTIHNFTTKHFTMKSTKAKNIFESSNFCLSLLKWLNLLFITIKSTNSSGNFYAVTTKFDLFHLFVWIIFGLWFCADILSMSVVHSSRSIIFEIGISLSSKSQCLQPFCVSVGTLLYRHEIFNALKDIYWIDQKVKLDFH